MEKLRQIKALATSQSSSSSSLYTTSMPTPLSIPSKSVTQMQLSSEQMERLRQLQGLTKASTPNPMYSLPSPASSYSSLSRTPTSSFTPPAYASSMIPPAVRPPRTSSVPLSRPLPPQRPNQVQFPAASAYSQPSPARTPSDVIDLTQDTDVGTVARPPSAARPAVPDPPVFNWVLGVLRTKVVNVQWDSYLSGKRPLNEEEIVMLTWGKPLLPQEIQVNNFLGLKVREKSTVCRCFEDRSNPTFPAR
jgi:hypothetical protein